MNIKRDEKKLNEKLEDIAVYSNRDIRTAPFEEGDFDISYTDSTNPLNEVLELVKEPGYDYIAAYNDPRRINALLAKRWIFVDPIILKNRPSFSLNERSQDYITIGDTILMKRDSRYGSKDDMRALEKNRSIMASSLSSFKRSNSPITQITNIDNPFST